MKLIHKVMILHATIMFIAGAFLFHAYAPVDLGCMTDTECEALD